MAWWYDGLGTGAVILVVPDQVTVLAMLFTHVLLPSCIIQYTSHRVVACMLKTHRPCVRLDRPWAQIRMKDPTYSSLRVLTWHDLYIQLKNL